MLLGKHQVSHIIMGHTVTKGVILPRFEGKGIIADVGLSRYYGENLACLLIENGEFYALHPAGRVKIPQEGGAEAVLSYLEEVSRLEPEHEAITARKIAFEKALSSEEDPEELDIPQDDP